MEAISAQTEPNAPTVRVSDAPVPPDIPSLQLLLASLTSFSKTMARCLGRSKPLDQTLSETIRRSTAALGPVVESVLKSQAVSQPASALGQAFLVEVVTVMLQCELSAVPVDPGAAPSSAHAPLYHSFCLQILKEIHSAPRPKDFLLSSLRFLSAFYCMVKRSAEEKSGGEEADELFARMLRTVFTLLAGMEHLVAIIWYCNFYLTTTTTTAASEQPQFVCSFSVFLCCLFLALWNAADWLSLSDLCGLEPAVEDLLGHLLDGSTTGQFNLLLLLIREGLDSSKLEAGSYKVRPSSKLGGWK